MPAPHCRDQVDASRVFESPLGAAVDDGDVEGASVRETQGIGRALGFDDVAGHPNRRDGSGAQGGEGRERRPRDE